MSQFIPAFIIAYSSSDFTNPHEVVLPDDPADCRNTYTHMGVKYWGLETKRHCATTVDANQKKIYFQHEACNWLRIGLRQRAELSELRASTKWFTGNQVRAISVTLVDKITGDSQQVLHQQRLQPDQEHHFTFPPTLATECFIQLHSEGGISRINFFGVVAKKQLPLRENLLAKAKITHVSNDHYGHPEMAVHGCRAEMFMKGWESARTGFGEQAIFQLEKASKIAEIVVDTYLHRLNPPLSCHVYGVLLKDGETLDSVLAYRPKWMLTFDCGTTTVPDDFQTYMLEQSYLQESVPNPNRFEVCLQLAPDSPWQAILPFECLQPDTYHRFTTLQHTGPFSHLLYLHYPNGGVHGLKVFSK